MSDFFSAVHLAQRSLDYHLERHNVLLGNVSNVDTPNYVPKDVERAPEFAGTLATAMTGASEGHLHGTTPNHAVGKVIEDKSAGAGKDGNYVSLDREAAKVAANQLRYDVISAIVSAELSQLAFASGDGKGG